VARTTGVPMKWSKLPISKGVIKLVSHLKLYDASEVASQRQKIILFYEKFGEKATKEAFGVDRKLIYVWKKRVRTRKGLQGLVPDSTAPKIIRHPRTDPNIVDFIKKQRGFVPRMSKYKLKPQLDKYCKQNNLPTVSIATIGRIIKRNNLFFYRSGKVYHDPASWQAKKDRIKAKVNRVRYAPKPKDLGYIQMDTVEKIIDGQKWFMYQAIDVLGKTALSLTYKRCNSKNTVDFSKKFTQMLPYKITTVQTDNGKEFKKEFKKYLSKNKIIHVFTYPRCPKVNGVVERFNRTLKEDFIEPNLHLIYNQKQYNKNLAKYMIYYNCQRPHENLNNMTPTTFLIQKGGMSNNLRSYTMSCEWIQIWL
jgi:transposase-like protein